MHMILMTKSASLTYITTHISCGFLVEVEIIASKHSFFSMIH